MFRVSDRHSQYLICNVIEKGSQEPTEVMFRILLYNSFTSINTWEALQKELGPLTWATYSQVTYGRVLRKRREDGFPIYTSAFQKPAPSLGYKEAFMNHLQILEVLMDGDIVGHLAKCTFMSDVFYYLRSIPGMGPFNAYQLLLDLSYSNIINFSQSDFVEAGCGAISGLRKCFGTKALGIAPEVMRWMQETQDEHFGRLGLTFNGLGKERYPLQLCDIEHTLCEVEKYSRTAHPNIKGPRTGIKVGKRPFQAAVENCPQTLHLPKAWSHPDRQHARINPDPPAKIAQRYVVDKIIAHRDTGTEVEYKVRWLGYSANADTWEPEGSLIEDVPLIIADYMKHRA